MCKEAVRVNYNNLRETIMFDDTDSIIDINSVVRSFTESLCNIMDAFCKVPHKHVNSNSESRKALTHKHGPDKPKLI